jgi:hypothetical protein
MKIYSNILLKLKVLDSRNSSLKRFFFLFSFFFFLFDWKWQRYVAKTGDDDQKLTGVGGGWRMVAKDEPLTTIGLTMGQKNKRADLSQNWGQLRA